MTVLDKTEERDIKLSFPKSSGYLTVNVTDSEGRRLNDCTFPEFSMKKNGGKETSRQPNVQPLQAKDGSYRIFYGEFGTSITENDAEELVLKVRSISCGDTSVTLSPPFPKEISVRFEAQGFLTLRISNFGAKGYEDRLKIELKDENNTNPVAASRQYVNYGYGGNQYQNFNLNGEFPLGPVQPGSYSIDVSLKIGRWQFTNIIKIPVDIKSGANSLTVDLPDLYSLKINAGSGSAGKNVNIMKEGEMMGQISKKLDKNGFAEFYDLPAGNYTLSIDGEKDSVSIPEVSVLNYD